MPDLFDDDLDEVDASAPPLPMGYSKNGKRVGRPPKNPDPNRPAQLKTGVRKVTEQRRTEYLEAPGDDTEIKDEEDQEPIPLFQSDVMTDKSVSRIRVIRKDPAEGLLGYLDDLSTGEAEISERWGGGTYRLEGITDRGAIKVVRILRLAGDPIFMSIAAESQWRRSRGLPPAARMGTSENHGGMNMQDLLVFQREQQAELRQAEQERRERERQEQREWDERRRRDDEERERRKARDDMERDERRRKDTIDAEARNQTFVQQMLTVMQQSQLQSLSFIKEVAATKSAGNEGGLMEAVKVIATIKDAFGGDGGEEPDIATVLIKNLGPILNGAGNAIGGAIREIRSTSGSRTSGTSQADIPNAGQLSALSALPEDSLLTAKISALAGKIAAKGQDPERVLSQVADGLLAAIDGEATAPIFQAGVTPTQVASAVVPAIVNKRKTTDVRKIKFNGQRRTRG